MGPRSSLSEDVLWWKRQTPSGISPVSYSLQPRQTLRSLSPTPVMEKS